MASVQARLNYGNQWELEYLPLDEFEQGQQLCDRFDDEDEQILAEDD